MMKDTLKFKVSAKLATLLGEQSVSNSTVALSELVKNAYDADATHVKIKFAKENDELTLTITDNGHGMTYNALENIWMVVGTSDKEKNPHSEGGRRKVGEKGIGRFAVQRLGNNLEFISKPHQNNEIISMNIDWSEYSDSEKRFTEIENPVSTVSRNDPDDTGLSLKISHLKDKWNKKDIENLEKQLSDIVPPIWSEKFDIIIEAPHAGLQQTRVPSALLQSSAYKMESYYNATDGKLHIKYFLSNKDHDDETIHIGPLKCGTIQFILYYYPLGISSKYRKMTPYVLRDASLKQQLQLHHGIKIFRDGFRVKPYGDPEDDWLGLNLRRVNDPTRAFSTNTIIGLVTINRDKNPSIIDTTTREGLIKNQAFRDMKTVLNTSISALSAQRIKDFGSEEEDIKSSSGIKKIAKAAASLSKHAKSPTQRARIDSATKQITASAIKIQSEFIDKMRMYYGLSSLGISVAAIAHEIGEPIGAILQRTKLNLENLDERPLSYEEILASNKRTLKDILKINEFMSFAAVFTSSEERRKSSVDIISIIDTVTNAYESIFKDQFIELDTNDIETNIPPIHGFKVDFESVMINLVTNAMEALRDADYDRKIKISCHSDGKGISLRFSDSGSGIPEDNQDIVFEPFITNKENGTGLGLPIVKEVLKNYNASISVVESELGGASFLIFIPKGETNGW